MLIALLAAGLALSVLVVSPLLAVANLTAPSLFPARHALLLTAVERQRFVVLLALLALPWMLLQAAWRAGLMAAAEAQLRSGSASPDDWLAGIARWAPELAARRVVALAASLVLLLACLLALVRLAEPGHWLWVPAFALAYTLHLFWRRTVAFWPAAMVAEQGDLVDSLAAGASIGLSARGPLAQLGCLADVGRVGCLWPLTLLAIGTLCAAQRHGLGPLNLAGAILLAGAMALLTAWLDAQRCVALLVLYRGLGGPDGDASLAVVGCRAPRERGDRAAAHGLTVASAPGGETWTPALVAGATPRSPADEPAL